MSQMHTAARRRFLRHTGHIVAAAALPAFAVPARASVGSRGLTMVHTHTQERIDLIYAVDGQYDPAALGSLNRFLRDHYSGEVGVIPNSSTSSQYTEDAESLDSQTEMTHMLSFRWRPDAMHRG